jgi:hypothetical protein
VSLATVATQYLDTLELRLQPSFLVFNGYFQKAKQTYLGILIVVGVAVAIAVVCLWSKKLIGSESRSLLTRRTTDDGL